MILFCSGPVVAGVIGMHKWCYDLYGVAMEEAQKMESHGTEGKMQISEATYSRLPKEKYIVQETQTEGDQDSDSLKSYFVLSKI